MSSDATKPLNGEIQGGGTTGGSADTNNTEAGRTVLVGVLGGIISAAGYLVYQRLPDDQKERLHRQVRGVLESRINELRSNFNL
jgi:predicted site-specific integrase-resolvase